MLVLIIKCLGKEYLIAGSKGNLDWVYDKFKKCTRKLYKAEYPITLEEDYPEGLEITCTDPNRKEAEYWEGAIKRWIYHRRCVEQEENCERIVRYLKDEWTNN